MKNFIESSQLHQDEPPNSEELAAERERERRWSGGGEIEKQRRRLQDGWKEGRNWQVGRARSSDAQHEMRREEATEYGVVLVLDYYGCRGCV